MGRGQMTRRLDWHWKALALWARQVPVKDIAVEVGRGVETVKEVLYSPWGKEQRREIEARAAESALAAAVDPVVKAQAKAPRMMDLMIGAAESAVKPLDVATIAGKVLDYAGYAPVAKSMHLSVEARIRDRGALPDDVLAAFANGGEIPEALRGLIVLPEPEAE